jgi:transcriptional regulator with XRE-family HTH domain
MPRYRQNYIGGVRPQTTLCALRKLCRLSQTELGVRCGTNQTAISDYENGLAIPEQHAKRIYSVLFALMPPEHLPIVQALDPSFLPQPWESVCETLTVEERSNDDLNRNALSTLVA